MSVTQKRGTTVAAGNPPSFTVAKQGAPVSSRSPVKPLNVVANKPKREPRPEPKLLPYVPPDALMFDLFSAIQRKAWVEARALCYELILCDPWNGTYRDLYERIDKIIKIHRERRRPRQFTRRIRTASSDSSDQRPTQRR